MTEWRETVAAILGAPGVVMLLGHVDVGKTTVATDVANAAVRAGRPPAVVDADPGQSDIGPPTTVGLGMVDRPVRQMLQVPLAAAYFAGDTSAQYAQRWVVDGAERLVARARQLGASIVIVDTAGWVEGPAAVAARVREIRRIAPRHVIAIQRADEVEPILTRAAGEAAVHRLRPAADARRRSPRERRAFRELQFSRYFREARRATLDLASVRAEREVAHAGRTIAPGRVLDALPPEALRHRLIGLAAETGDLVGLATIVAARPGERAVDLIAPADAVARARVLQWGAVRVAPDGREERRAAGAA